MSKNNQQATQLQPRGNPGSNGMERFVRVLKKSIDDFGYERRTADDPFYDPYTELSMAMGRSVSTIRKWTNPFSGQLPSVADLETICILMHDRTPMDAFIHSFNRAFEGKSNGNDTR